MVQLVPLCGQHRCGKRAATVIRPPHVQIVGVRAHVPPARGVEGDGRVATVRRVLQGADVAPARTGIDRDVRGDMRLGLLVVGYACTQQVAGVAGVCREGRFRMGDELVVAHPHVAWPTRQRRRFRHRSTPRWHRFRRQTGPVTTGTAGHQAGTAPDGELEHRPSRDRHVFGHRQRSQRRELPR
jgi:hypothetical protein